jgi:sugar phosphate isomerase/epimerase
VFAVSTCWKSSLAESADDILRPILDLGVTAIELEYRITEKIFKGMLPALKRGEPETVSAHNFFPLPPDLTRGQASGDAFLLASPEKEERERAVKYTLRTIEQAHEVGARAVVLHMGKTRMDDDFISLTEEHEKKALGDNSIRDRVKILVEERKKEGLKHIDAALFSLDKLWRAAERFGIKLGIENRYHLREIPNPHEMAIFLDRFEGSNIGYWHDVGHAAVQELLYGIDHEQVLSRFSPRIIGVHLHDADGVKDHKAPGKGEVNFKMVEKFIRPDTIRVIELAPDESEEDFRKGIEFLAGIFG